MSGCSSSRRQSPNPMSLQANVSALHPQGARAATSRAYSTCALSAWKRLLGVWPGTATCLHSFASAPKE